MTDVQKWLDDQTPKQLRDVSAQEFDALKALINNAGFGALLGLLAAEQQGYYFQLGMLNLEDAAQRWTASVLQGKIQGIERVKQTMVELLANDTPTDDGDTR